MGKLRKQSQVSLRSTNRRLVGWSAEQSMSSKVETRIQELTVDPEHLRARLYHRGLNNKSTKMEVCTSLFKTRGRCGWFSRDEIQVYQLKRENCRAAPLDLKLDSQKKTDREGGWLTLEKTPNGYGPDNIPGCALMDCADHLSGVLIDIFNPSLTQAAAPTCLKTATLFLVPIIQKCPFSP